MNKTRWFLGLGALSTLGVAMAMMLGCGGASANSGGGSSSGDGYTGTLTVTNNTGESVCKVEVLMDDGYVSSEEEVEPGGSTEIELSSPSEYIYATSCSGDGFAYQNDVVVDGSTFALEGGSEQTFQGRYEYLLQLNRMSVTEPAQDASLVSQFQQATEVKARDAGWDDTPTVLRVASEWDILRNRRTSIITGRRIAALVGHRFSDGHCSIQIHTYAQGHDGNDFAGTISYEGSAGNITTGCSMIDAFEGGGSGGSSGGGGGGDGCTNTCSSANDGDCDDGGPGADYDVCAFGTDCGDCGPR